MLPSTPQLLSMTAAIKAADAAATTAFLVRANAVTTLDGTHTAAYKALINGLVADGVFSKLDFLFILATQSSGVALLNLVSTSFSPAVASNSPTFAVDLGYTGNGSNASLNPSFNPSTAGGLYTQNSAHLMAWCVNLGSNSPMGSAGDSMLPNFSANTYMRVNNAAGDSPVAADPGNNGIGCYIASRTSSSVRSGYKNGSALGSANSVTSVALSNSAMTILGSAQANFTNGQIAAAGVGGALTSTDAGNYYSRLRTYMTAVGVP